MPPTPQRGLFDPSNDDAVQRQAPLATRMRPKSLADMVGQQTIIGDGRMLRRAIEHDTLFSMILWGPPGCGKTTLARIIAEHTQAHFEPLSAVTAGVADLRRVVSEARDRLGMYRQRTVLFIDEIHRLSPVVEEILYPALEDFQIDILIGEGPAARSVKLDLQPFTLVGATTRAGMLTNPLRDRFGIVSRLEFYTPEELTRIATRSAGLLQVPITPDGASEVARRSRGTPRIANRLLRRVRDYAQVKAKGTIDATVANAALAMLEVDPQGLDLMDRKLLEAIVHKFDGGPVGVDSLAAAIGEERDTIEDVIEPYLIQHGYLQRTPRGRMATQTTWRHLGLTPPKAPPADGPLFAE